MFFVLSYTIAMTANAATKSKKIDTSFIRSSVFKNGQILIKDSIVRYGVV